MSERSQSDEAGAKTPLTLIKGWLKTLQAKIDPKHRWLPVAWKQDQALNKEVLLTAGIINQRLNFSSLVKSSGLHLIRLRNWSTELLCCFSGAVGTFSMRGCVEKCSILCRTRFKRASLTAKPGSVRTRIFYNRDDGSCKFRIKEGFVRKDVARWASRLSPRHHCIL